MTSLLPIDGIDELDEPQEPTDQQRTHASEVDQLMDRDELELPPELIGVPFS